MQVRRARQSAQLLYVGGRTEVDRLLAHANATVVASLNPYWDRVGVTVTDPDGFPVVLVAASWPS